jgi:hypothetical protein
MNKWNKTAPKYDRNKALAQLTVMHLQTFFAIGKFLTLPKG